MTEAAIPPAVVADAAAAAKAWLRAPVTGGEDGGDDETAIAALCVAAIALAEAFCGRVLVARPFSDVVLAGGEWRPLAAAPVTAITAVTLGDGTALATGVYALDIDPGGTGWVRASLPAGPDRITVAYAAGEAGAWSALPAPVAQGITMLVAHLFDDRDAAATPPAAVAALWRPWRRLRLATETRA